MNIEITEGYVSHEDPTPEQELADATATYNKLLVEILNVCSNYSPTVAIAAAASAMGCMAVEAIPDEAAAHRYLQACTTDVRNRLPEAYGFKAKGYEDGTDSRGPSKIVNQVMAE